MDCFNGWPPRQRCRSKVAKFKALIDSNSRKATKRAIFGEKNVFDNMQFPCDKRKPWKPAVQVTAFQTIFVFELGGTHFLSSMWAIFETSRK